MKYRFYSILLLSFFLLPAPSAFACRPPADWEWQTLEAEGLIFTTGALSPTYTNLDKYTRVRTIRGNSCGPYSTYIRTAPLILGGTGVFFIFVLLPFALYKRYRINKK